jgi:transposase
VASERRKEIVMNHFEDIVLVADYHDQNIVVRRLNRATGVERMETLPTTATAITEMVESARREAAEVGGGVIWVMESTTGWARVADLLGSSATVVLANVLQMPRLPKAYRRKTDAVDTGRSLREYLCDRLPTAYQPPRPLRAVRRLVAARESLVSRRTAVRNWINRYLAHETWAPRCGLWSGEGQRRLRALAESQAGPDGLTLSIKLDELASVETMLGRVEGGLLAVYRQWPDAHRLDEIYGIAEVSAVSILARIGPIRRFANAEALIAFAGLAPGVRQSDSHRRDGRIGGGGTDKRLRHYVIEATVWARRIPRYRATDERVEAKRGRKIARLVVGRLLLRSIYKMLTDNVRFNQTPAA